MSPAVPEGGRRRGAVAALSAVYWRVCSDGWVPMRSAKSWLFSLATLSGGRNPDLPAAERLALDETAATSGAPRRGVAGVDAGLLAAAPPPLAAGARPLLAARARRAPLAVVVGVRPPSLLLRFSEDGPAPVPRGVGVDEPDHLRWRPLLALELSPFRGCSRGHNVAKEGGSNKQFRRTRVFSSSTARSTPLHEASYLFSSKQEQGTARDFWSRGTTVFVSKEEYARFYSHRVTPVVMGALSCEKS